MYKIKNSNYNIEKCDCYNNNTTCKHKLITTYIEVKNNYKLKIHMIKNNLNVRIETLKVKIRRLEKNKALEYKIKTNFILNIENIIILKNTNSIKNNDIDKKSASTYLYLNPIYNRDTSSDKKVHNNYNKCNTNIKINNTLKTIILILHNDNFKEKSKLNYRYENEYNYNYNYNSLELCNMLQTDIRLISYNNSDKNPICKLMDFQKCQTILHHYNKYYINQIEKNVNKNKIFTIQIKSCKEQLAPLLIKRDMFISTLLKLRTAKIDYYKSTNKKIITGLIYNLLNNNCNGNVNDGNENVNLSSITDFFFFDTKEIFTIIDTIKHIDLEINTIRNEIKIIEVIKNKYNSLLINNLHSSIKNNKCNYNNYYGQDEKDEKDNSIAFNYIKTKYSIGCKHTDNLNSNTYPIIINNVSSFKHFENDINAFLIKNIKLQIETCNSNIGYLDMDIKTHITQLNYLLDKQQNKNVNRELHNNYIYYNNKLTKIETLLLHYL